MIHRKEGEKTLKRAVRAAPSFIVQSLMSIMEIENVSTDQPAWIYSGHCYVWIAENAMNENHPMIPRGIACDVLSRRKQRIGGSKIGTIRSKSKAMIPLFPPVQFRI